MMSLAKRELATIEKAKTEASKPLPSLIDYIPTVSPHLDPPRHFTKAAELFERAEQGGIRAVLNTPPQHGKSTLCFHQIARLLKKRRIEVLYLSYSNEFAEDQMREARPIAEAAAVPLVGAPNLTKWRTSLGGTLFAAGIGGAVTGRPARLIIVDDPIKDWASAQSKKIRDEVWNWFVTCVLTRARPETSIVVVQTRWHEDDISARLLKLGWEHCNLPAIDSEGRALWPEARPIEWLEKQREQMGLHLFEALYQQNPRPRGGTVFGDVHYYDADELPTVGYTTALGIDLAYSKKSSADYSVLVELRRTRDGTCYVTDVAREQCGAPAFGEIIERYRQRNPGAGVRWYASGTEKGVADLLTSAGIRIDATPAIADKFARAQPVAAAWNAGKVLLPRPPRTGETPRWIPVAVDEITSFTGIGDAHDDIVDALAAAYDEASDAPDNKIESLGRSDTSRLDRWF